MVTAGGEEEGLCQAAVAGGYDGENSQQAAGVSWSHASCRLADKLLSLLPEVKALCGHEGGRCRYEWGGISNFACCLIRNAMLQLLLLALACGSQTRASSFSVHASISSTKLHARTQKTGPVIRRIYCYT